MDYFFVGSESDLDGKKLSRLGQKITLTDEVAKIAVLGCVALLPAETFEEIGFTEQELSLYPTRGMQATGNADLKAKLTAAFAAANAYRHELETPVSEGK
jgi:hypothetical protein